MCIIIGTKFESSFSEKKFIQKLSSFPSPQNDNALLTI